MTRVSERHALLAAKHVLKPTVQAQDNIVVRREVI